MARKNCQSSSLDLDSLTIYHSKDLDVSCLNLLDVSCILLPDTLTFIFCHSFTFMNFYIYIYNLQLIISISLDISLGTSSKNFSNANIRYAKSYANSDFNSKQNKNKRVNNLICLSFMDKIKSQIFTLKIKKTDENKEVNYVQSV